MEYKILRHHKRKKLLITVNAMGEVIVKAGIHTSEKYIENFVNSKLDWIENRKKYFAAKFHTRVAVNKAEIPDLKKQLLPEMIQLTGKYAEIMGVAPKSIKITSAQKRWGSCGTDNAICYSYQCAFLSRRCKEYIVVHELSHIKEHNHSPNFYNVLKTYLPDYKDREKELTGYYIHLV